MTINYEEKDVYIIKVSKQELQSIGCALDSLSYSWIKSRNRIDEENRMLGNTQYARNCNKLAEKLDSMSTEVFKYVSILD
jgi:hypothetical protein